MVCGKTFHRGMIDLVRHSEAVTLLHTTSAKQTSAFQYGCSKCGLYFKNEEHLTLHQTQSSCNENRSLPSPVAALLPKPSTQGAENASPPAKRGRKANNDNFHKKQKKILDSRDEYKEASVELAYQKDESDRKKANQDKTLGIKFNKQISKFYSVPKLCLRRMYGVWKTFPKRRD